MKAILTLLVVSALVGLVTVAWLVLLAVSLRKKVKNKAVLKRWLQIYLGLVPVFMLMAGCSPGEMVGTGYLVTVEKGILVKWDRLETAAEVDHFIREKAGLTVNTDSLIGTDRLYYDLKNGDGWYVYVERQGIYQRKPDGKKRWRVYDEDLTPALSKGEGERKENQFLNQ